MLLRTIVLILIFSFPVSAAVMDMPHHNIDTFKNDIPALERILSRKPGNLDALERIIRISFVSEDFSTTLKYADKFLALKEYNKYPYLLHKKHVLLKRYKLISYIRILSLANLGRYSDAVKSIDEYIEIYRNKISGDELHKIKIKKEIYKKSIKAKPFPDPKLRQTSWGNNKLILSIIDRKKICLVYDFEKEKNRVFKLKNNQLEPVDRIPEFLSGLYLDDIIFISLSDDGREVLASVKTYYGAKVKYRKFNGRYWSSWKTIGEMNPGSWNSYANFTPSSDCIIFVSNVDKSSGFDIFLTRKNVNGYWSRAEKIKNINTLLEEPAVYLHPDGKTMYFSSNGRIGNGGYDIYMANFNKKKGAVSDISNLDEVNTFRNEIFPLLVHAINERGYLNYSAANRLSVLSSNNFKRNPIPVSFFDAFVYDSKTMKPVENIIVTIKGDAASDELHKKTCHDGFFGTVLRHNERYSISIRAPGYLPIIKDYNANINAVFLNEKFLLKIKKTYKAIVYSLKNINVSQNVINTANTNLIKKIKNISQIILVPNKQINEKLMKDRKMIKCYDIACVMGIAKKIPSDLAFTGSLQFKKFQGTRQLGKENENQYLLKKVRKNYYEIFINVIDIKTGKILKKIYKRIPNLKLLDEVLNKIAREIETLTWE